MITTTALAIVLGLPVARGADEGFARYRVILERQPFGEPPPAPGEGGAPALAEAPPWATSYRLCSVYADSDQRVRVALLDLKTNKPIMLTLGRGPSEGIELLAADIAKEEARVRKNGQAITMKLEASRQQATRRTASTGRPAAAVQGGALTRSAAGRVVRRRTTIQPRRSLLQRSRRVASSSPSR